MQTFKKSESQDFRNTRDLEMNLGIQRFRDIELKI